MSIRINKNGIRTRPHICGKNCPIHKPQIVCECGHNVLTHSFYGETRAECQENDCECLCWRPINALKEMDD